MSQTLQRVVFSGRVTVGGIYQLKREPGCLYRVADILPRGRLSTAKGFTLRLHKLTLAGASVGTSIFVPKVKFTKSISSEWRVVE